MEKAKKMKCYKRLIYKQFYKSQVYVAHSFRVICRNISRTILDFVWRRHICVLFWYTNMAAANQR